MNDKNPTSSKNFTNQRLGNRLLDNSPRRLNESKQHIVAGKSKSQISKELIEKTKEKIRLIDKN